MSQRMTRGLQHAISCASHGIESKFLPLIHLCRLRRSLTRDRARRAAHATDAQPAQQPCSAARIVPSLYAQDSSRTNVSKAKVSRRRHTHARDRPQPQHTTHGHCTGPKCSIHSVSKLPSKTRATHTHHISTLLSPSTANQLEPYQSSFTPVAGRMRPAAAGGLTRFTISHPVHNANPQHTATLTPSPPPLDSCPLRTARRQRSTARRNGTPAAHTRGGIARPTRSRRIRRSRRTRRSRVGSTPNTIPIS